MRSRRTFGSGASALALVSAFSAWQLGRGTSCAATVAGDPPDASSAAHGAPNPATAPLPTVPGRRDAAGSSLREAPVAAGRLVRAPDGQLYEDFPDGRRVLHTTVRMRDGAGREWDEPVEIEATPVDPRRRDVPPARR